MVTPVHKKGVKTDPNNCRPISIIPIIAKICEKVIMIRLTKFFEKNNLLSKNQFGFRSNLSTNHAIYNFLHKILLDFQNRKYPVGICCDLSKAFDSVNHTILLNKLSHYGVKGSPLKWFELYLSNRTQIVKINRNGFPHFSQVKLVSKGVPQGSILGPFLFIIYVNDLPFNVSGAMTQFADDTSLALEILSPDESEEEITANMNELQQWFLNNNLSLNTAKTKILFFLANTTKNSLKNHAFEVENTKFLGLDIDNSLQWNTHVENLSKKLISINYILLSLRQVVDRSTLLTAYFGLLHSKMSYGIPFWGGKVTNMERIFKIQKRAIRTIFGLGPYDSCKNYFTSEKILTLPSIYILQISEMVKNKTVVTSPRAHQYETRGKDLTLPCTFRLALLQKNIDFLGPKIFNNLPTQIKNITGPLKFKKKLKDWLIDKVFYSLEEFFADNERKTAHTGTDQGT